MIAWLKSLLRKIGLGGEQAGEDFDPELREVFFAEMDDMTQLLERAFAVWRVNAADDGALKNLRRGFHTIKSSAMLVGATELGQFSRQFEQLAIRLVENRLKITPAMVVSIDQAIALLPAFSKSIRDGRPPPPQAYALGKRVERLVGA